MHKKARARAYFFVQYDGGGVSYEKIRMILEYDLLWEKDRMKRKIQPQNKKF